MKKFKRQKKGGSKVVIPPGGYSFVIGNGTSRRDLDIKKVKDYGAVIACNWFFREEFHPDVLVCSDEPITKTVLKVYPGYAKRNWFVTWFPKPGSGAKKASSPEKFAAGPMSADWACTKLKSSKVFLIGMDFFGFGSKSKDVNGKINNLYHGKKHYIKDKDAGAPTYRNWQRRYEWIIRNNPGVEFYHVNPFEGKSPERLRGYNNFYQITWDNLIDHLNNDVELENILERTQEDYDLLKMPNQDDVRATIERHLAGQENILYQDILTEEEVLNIRRKAVDHYTKNPTAGIASINIMGFDIMLPQQGIKEGNIVRPPNEKEIIYMYQKDTNDRQRKMKEMVESGIKPMQLVRRDKPPKPKKQSSMLPPPPPPGMNLEGGLPPPPPPPSI